MVQINGAVDLILTAHAVSRPWIVAGYLSAAFHIWAPIRAPCFYLFMHHKYFLVFIIWLWETVRTESTTIRPEGLSVIRPTGSGSVRLCGPARCVSRPRRATVCFGWLLGAASLCQLSQECPRQPRRGQDLMLLFHAKSHIGRPCFITPPPPVCVWPFLFKA